jgi:hypothetical protein
LTACRRRPGAFANGLLTPTIGDALIVRLLACHHGDVPGWLGFPGYDAASASLRRECELRKIDGL